MADLIEKGQLEFKKPMEKTIAYHDPCELGRISGIFDAPRKVLESVPGLTVKELAKNRSECNCCGNGGGYNSLEPDNAMNISLNKIDEVLETNAELLVSSCPNCRYGLSNAILEKKKIISENGGEEIKLDMMDITELVGKVVK